VCVMCVCVCVCVYVCICVCVFMCHNFMLQLEIMLKVSAPEKFAI
jgi:hypothetical protein